jgi:hypothetical protein
MSTTKQNPLSDFLPVCPAPGEGVHSWLMKAAWTAKKMGLPAESAIAAISSAISRTPRSREIEEAVAKVFATVPAAQIQPPIKARFDPAALQQLAEKLPKFTEADLTDRSPFPPDMCTAAIFLQQLFQPGEKVALFADMASRCDLLWSHPGNSSTFDENELACLQNPESGKGVWFLANPVFGGAVAVERLKTDANPLGLTFRAEENLTTFRYLVLESDKAESDKWLKALVQMPLSISSVVTSGGRSIHALVRIDARIASSWKDARSRIAPALVTLGADLGAMTTVRLTRLPFSFRRENNAWQRLLFLDPTPTSLPICQMPVRGNSHDSNV